MRARVVVRLPGIVAVLASLIGLTGCTPAELPVTALSYVDGRPVLLIADCAEFDTRRISVFTVGATPAARWRADREQGVAPEEVPLLELPQGWTVDEDTLTTFDPGTDYKVGTFGASRRAVFIGFTVDQLEALSPGQVLVGEAVGKGKAVSASRFRSKAKKACD